MEALPSGNDRDLLGSYRAVVLAVGCGDLHTEALAAAGYQVDRPGWIEFSRLEQVDLLLLALSPPEPPAHDLVRHLRGRSSTPVVALVENQTDAEHAAVIEAGAADCLDAPTDDAGLLAHIGALLSKPGSALAAASRVGEPMVAVGGPGRGHLVAR